MTDATNGRTRQPTAGDRKIWWLWLFTSVLLCIAVVVAAFHARNAARELADLNARVVDATLHQQQSRRVSLLSTLYDRALCKREAKSTCPHRTSLQARAAAVAALAHIERKRVKNPDLMGIDLAGARLEKVDLSLARLGNADLSRVDFENGSISQAMLRYANLSEANLLAVNARGTTLVEANLTKVVLRKADLREAQLGGAKLDRADLFGADLRRAEMDSTSLANADLRGADLRGARHLTQAQLDACNSCKGARLPSGLVCNKRATGGSLLRLE